MSICSCVTQVRLKDALVSSLQFCRAKDTELAWIDGVLDMRVEKVDTGVIAEVGDVKDEGEDGDPAMEVTTTSELTTEPSSVANQRAMKTLFGEDEREISEESDVIPTLEPLPVQEVSERDKNIALLASTSTFVCFYNIALLSHRCRVISLCS